MSINLTVVIDNDEAIKKFKELQKVAKSTTSNIVTDSERMDMAMRKFGSALASLGVSFSLTELVRQVATVRGEFQQLEVAFATMLGNKAEADALMERAMEFAATTPFDIKGVADGTKQLLAYGSTAEEVMGELRMLGDVAAGMSLPLGDLVYLYGTTRTQGRLFTRDLLQFTGRGIPLMEELAKQFGVSKDQVSKLVTEGKVGFAEVQKAIVSMTSAGGKFDNLMAKQAKTITGQMRNLKDSIQQMFNEIGKESEGAISTAIGGASYLVENYKTIGTVLMDVVAAYGSYKAAVMLVNAVSKVRAVYLATEASATIAATVANNGLAKSLTMIANALKASNLAKLADPYVLAAAAIGGLIFGVYKLITAKSAEEKAQEAVNEKMDEYKKKLDQDTAKAQEAASKMKDANASAYERVAAYNTLVEAYPELLAKYDEEKIKLMELADLNREIAQINRDRTMAEWSNEKASLETQLQEINDRRRMGVDGNLTYANAMDAGKAKTIIERLKQVNKAIDEEKKLAKEAEFEALSVSDKIAEYEKQNAELERKIVEYTGRMNQALRLGQKELAKVYSDTINAAKSEKANIQKNIDSLKNANKQDAGGSGASDIEAIAKERQNAQEGAHKAEIALQKSYLTDKAMLLQLEMEEELKAIDKRIKATTDAETKAYLMRQRAATEALYTKQVDEALREDENIIVPRMTSMFSQSDRDKMFQLNMPNVSEVLRKSAEENIPAINALFGDMRNMTSDDLNAIADAAEAMLSTIDDPEVLAAMREQIDKFRNKAIELENPLEKIKNGIKGLFSFKPNTEGWNTAFESLREGLEGVLVLTEELDDVLESLGAGEALDGTIDGMNAALDAMDAVKKGAAMGQAFGGIGAAAGAAIGAVGSLVKSISQIHDKNSEKRIENLQEQIDDVSRSYDRLGRALEDAYSTEAVSLIERQNRLLEKQRELIEQQIAEEDDKKNTDNDRIKQWENEIEGITDSIAENTRKAQEAITGISFDSFYDSFVSTLADMNTTSEDFARNFEEYMKNAILGAMIAETYKDRIQQLYDDFAKANKDGQITEQELNDLRQQEQAIAEDMLKERKELADVYGWSGDEGGSTSSSGGGGFQAMSQETGSELNGRFTDIQGKVTEIRSFVMEMMSAGKLQHNELINIRDVMIQLNGNVGDIKTYTKVLPEMRDAINSMNKKLDNL